MSILRKLMLILPVALVFSATGWAQTSQFEGTVKGADGKPAQGAEIRIERQDVKGHYKTKTDKKGHYFYGGLPLGNYKLTVAMDGSDKDAQNMRSKLGETQDVSFDLAKSAAAASGGAPPDESNRAESPADKAKREAQNKEQAAAMAKNKALNDAFGQNTDPIFRCVGSPGGWRHGVPDSPTAGRTSGSWERLHISGGLNDFRGKTIAQLARGRPSRLRSAFRAAWRDQVQHVQ